MEHVKIIIDIVFDKNNSYTQEDLVQHIDFQYLTQALDFHGIEHIEVTAEIIE